MSSQVRYAPDVRIRFPQLRSRVLLVEDIHERVDAGSAIGRLTVIADQRLAAGSEGEFPEIQAWRRAFSVMGLKPTQYRCASEALLRRYRKEGTLPALHPLISLCNAASLAYAIPVAVFDTSRVIGPLTVRLAQGDECYETFSGETEHPEPGEVIFADAMDRAHARRWTNRQSGWSAVHADTRHALIITEALHASAEQDVERLSAALHEALTQTWPGCSVSKMEP